MILTVTPNSALDHILFIDEWTPGVPMRTTHVVPGVGGKGLDVSIALRRFGVDSIGVAMVAGETGKKLVGLVESYGVWADPVWVAGETRTAHVVVERIHHRHTHLIEGEMHIQPEHVAALMARIKQHLPRIKYVICAGSIPKAFPPTFYGDVLREAAPFKIPALIDSSGDPLLNALPAKPEIIKLNHEEFNTTFDRAAHTLPDRIDTGRAVTRQHGLNALVITCGQDGILAFTAEGIFHAVAPVQITVNAAGAGDVTSAALVWRLLEGDSWQNALVWAAAAGAASVLTERTADVHLADVERLRPDVKMVCYTN